MESLGHDIVNHCVNDILVQSPHVKPWTFLDYFATNKLDGTELRYFVKGVSDACAKVGCSLIGGETAEIPGIYREGVNDLVGAITGIVLEDELLQPKFTIEAGDLVFAIESDSPHTNGYTLIQKLIQDCETTNDHSYLRHIDAWCRPHRCYSTDVNTIYNDCDVEIKGLCHITGGGYIDNPPRIIDESLKFEFDYNLIVSNMPEWMKWLYERVISSGSNDQEVFRTFNCGYGMLVVVNPDQKDKFTNVVKKGIKGTFIGRIVPK
jgi:phosphoribosylaminoimidazole synthetase